ncbi:MAG TPA: enoyl-CoA hydratase/isomerase family protein [Rugosimonospora sp.]|nr:enoyl-CoA hydratase/isomerase family protein [Rugosimonospora sp.]
MLLSLSELAGGRAAAPLLDGAGQVVDPLLAVDLDAAPDPGLLRAACEAAGASDRILVGVRTGEPPGEPWHELLAALDVTLARAPLETCVAGAGVDQLTAAANANPQAALALAQVLYAGRGLGVRAALDVESFAYSTLLGGAEFGRWLAARGPRPLPPAATVPPVLVERAADRLGITLNRPERRNAYGRELRDGLVDALRVAVLDPTVAAVTLSGAGPAFCSGGDLDEFGTAPDTATAHFVRTRGGAGELLHRVADRTEVRLHGPCVGAGIELAAFAGRVVARPDARFRLPEVGMGLIPGAGGTVSIPRRIGRWRALYLALSGTWLDAATAARWGLVDAVERDGE